MIALEKTLQALFAKFPPHLLPYSLFATLAIIGLISLVASIIGCFFVRRRPWAMYGVFASLLPLTLIIAVDESVGDDHIFTSGAVCILAMTATIAETWIRRLGRGATWLTVGTVLITIGLFVVLVIFAQMGNVSSGPCPRPPTQAESPQ